MEGLIHEKMSLLKLEAVAIVVLVLLAACGDEDAGPPRTDVQETERDDQADCISISGSIAFPNTRAVTFETQGALGRLAVEEGQTVRAGQPVAYMDRDTMIALEGALAQARVDASMAREAIANALAPPSPLEIAQAEAKVANAREALRTAEEKLLSLLHPTGHDIATVESARADTMLKIDGLRDEIDSLARGPDEEELEHLRSHARSDETVLENALRSESLTEQEWDVKVGRASGEVEEAAEEYRAFFLTWLGVEAQDVDADLSPDALLKQWGADLKLLHGRSRVDSRLGQTFPDNNPSTAWNEQTI